MVVSAYLRRHSKTGIYWFRRAVPVQHRVLFGKCEIVRSLRTRDPRQARREALRMAWEMETVMEGQSPTSTPLQASAHADLASLVEAAVVKALKANLPIQDAPQSRPESGITFDQAFVHYQQERKLRAQSYSEFSTVVRRFREVAGENLSVAVITKAHIRTFKDAILQMPKVLSQADRKLPVPQLLVKFDGDAIERVSTTTVRKALGIVNVLLEWCVKNGHLDTNPALGVKPVAEQRHEQDRRLPYEQDDLRIIFNSPLYRGCASEQRRSQAGSLIIKDASYWLPLLGLYTGCRLEELGQLLTSDVRCEDGVFYLDINAWDSEKSLKTKGSCRKVPLHPKLIEAGFIVYVATQTRQASDRVFPELIRNARGKTTAAWSKWWGRYCTQIGLMDQRKVFHSFRHTFKDACRAAGIEEAIHDALTGHAAPHVGRTYGKGYPLRMLADAVGKVLWSFDE